MTWEIVSFVLAVIIAGDGVAFAVMRRRRPRRRQWEIRITTPDGVLVDVTTRQLAVIHRFGRRSTDGYLDLMAEHRLAGFHVWVRPVGWIEASQDDRLAGTGTRVYD